MSDSDAESFWQTDVSAHSISRKLAIECLHVGVVNKTCGKRVAKLH